MNWRIPIGFIFAPVVPCAILVAPGMIRQPEWTGVWLFISYMVVVSWLISLIVAVPIYFFLRRYWKVGLTQCVFAGAVIAAAVCAVAVLTSMGGNFSASDAGGATVIDGQYTAHGWWQNALTIGSMALLGAGIGLVFWATALWTPSARANEA